MSDSSISSAEYAPSSRKTAKKAAKAPQDGIDPSLGYPTLLTQGITTEELLPKSTKPTDPEKITTPKHTNQEKMPPPRPPSAKEGGKSTREVSISLGSRTSTKPPKEEKVVSVRSPLDLGALGPS